MTPEEKDQNLIDRYLRNELSSEERQAVEQRLLKEEDFKEQMALKEGLLEVIREGSNKELKGFLQKVETERKEKRGNGGKKNLPHRIGKKTPPSLWKILTPIAAAVLIGVLGLWVINQQKDKPGKLYADYFTNYPNEIVQIERSQGKGTSLQNAFLAYQEKNYLSAIIQFELLQQQSPNDSLKFYQAIALMADNKNLQALSLLKTLAQKESWHFSEVVNWYLALALLKNKEPMESRIILQQIAKQPDGHFQQSAAKEILEKW